MGLLKLGETMTAQLSKVHPPKVNAKGDTYFKVEFITKPFNTWGCTYLCPDNYNFKNWEDILNHQGVWVTNISWKDEEDRLIDADSKVIYHKLKRNKVFSQLSLF